MNEMLQAGLSPEVETAPRSSRRSARIARVEIITSREPRRAWTPEQKREIVLESLDPGQTPTEVARKHAISSGMLYTWRQQILGQQLELVARSTARFVPVEVSPSPQRIADPDPPPPVSSSALSSSRSDSLIEIILPGGICVRVGAQVDDRALRRVLRVLDSR